MQTRGWTEIEPNAPFTKIGNRKPRWAPPEPNSGKTKGSAGTTNWPSINDPLRMIAPSTVPQTLPTDPPQPQQIGRHSVSNRHRRTNRPEGCALQRRIGAESHKRSGRRGPTLNPYPFAHNTTSADRVTGGPPQDAGPGTGQA